MKRHTERAALKTALIAKEPHRRKRGREPQSVDHYEVVEESLGGANEKNLLEDPVTGSRYVAKLGRRNNDLEVMTEYIIYLVGRNIGARVAEAKMALYDGKLRFLSKYFLDRSRGEELVHGIQLFQELYDESTIKAVTRDEAREQAMFNLQAIRSAFGAHYVEYGPHVEDELFQRLIDMVVHDAIIGIQDRHHENWGIIVQRGRDAPPPRFSPLYDSARGLFCNESDKELARYVGREGEQRLSGYLARSRPLMGWEGLRPGGGRKYVAHHELVASLYNAVPSARLRIRSTLAAYDWQGLRHDLWSDVGFMCSGRRISLILSTLRRRIRLINRAISGQ